jgi:hypothetical protein
MNSITQTAKNEHYFENQESDTIILRRAYQKTIAKYKAANRDINNPKYECLCGGEYTHSNLGAHCKTKKHRQYELDQESDDSESDDSD